MSSALVEKTTAQALLVARHVSAASTDRKLRACYDGLRASQLPFLVADDASALFRASFAALFTLGQASVPLAVGFTMHQYMFAALASVRVADKRLARRLKDLVDDVRKRRLLVAVSSFGAGVSTAHVRFTIARDGDGFVFDGERSFQSMASEADLITVVAPVDGGDLGAFIVPMKGRAGVTVHDAVFGGPMALTDTRAVTFSGYRAVAADVVTLDAQHAHRLGAYSTAWFEALIGAAYLGGAAAALEEVRLFARSARAPSGEPLHELDGAVVDAGRLGISLRTSLALAMSFVDALARGSEADDFTSVMMAGTLLKYACTRSAEAIVTGARRLLGTRAMRQGSLMAELTGQIVFGPLHPWLEAELERAVGADVLGDAPFVALG